MRHCWILLIAVILLSACAKPPNLELDATEYMVNRARALQAVDYAPAEFRAAVAALDDAQRAIKSYKYAAARSSLDFALHHARRSVNLTRERKARQAEEADRLAREEAIREAEALQLQAEDVTPIEPAKLLPPKPVPRRKPETPPLFATYHVGNGENLWTISAHPQVYNDGLLWPLLYQANRDQIKDPRQIFPGQSLNIRRDLSRADMEQARQKARESDIFPVSSQPAVRPTGKQ